MAEERVLDLGRVDVLAARDDHVRDPVVDVEIALRVEIAGVAGMEPAAAHGPRRLLGQVPVARHVLRRAAHDLADLARRHRVVLAVDDGDLDALHRLAARQQALGS